MSTFESLLKFIRPSEPLVVVTWSLTIAGLLLWFAEERRQVDLGGLPEWVRPTAFIVWFVSAAHVGVSTAMTLWNGATAACALIWLAGSRKTIFPGGDVGFHQAWSLSTSQTSEPGNARIGAYLARLGYGPEVIRFFTLAPPKSMIWLTPAIVKELGLDVIGGDRAPMVEKSITAPKCRDDAEKITGTCKP
jgi:hypothetical protein